MLRRDNGLDTLPGTAAEILDDDVRAVLSRNKLSTEQWKQVIRTAHRCGIRSTSTLMYGRVETPAHWVNQLMLLREIQAETGGFTEFVPLDSCTRTRCCSIRALRGPVPPSPSISRFTLWPGFCWRALSTTSSSVGEAGPAACLNFVCMRVRTITAGR